MADDQYEPNPFAEQKCPYCGFEDMANHPQDGCKIWDGWYGSPAFPFIKG